jgi:hypothetical protein
VPEFVTVFEITRNSNGVFGDEVFRLLVGVVALIGGIRFLVRNWIRESSVKDYIGPVFVLIWSLFWLYLHLLPNVFGHINGLLDAYRNKRYEVVEGPVRVLHRQPSTGHSKGDIIEVKGKQFEVNYFYATPAYNKTLAHGGVLGDGVYTRIYHFNGEILRVEIRK